ncbi:hypothetical protein K490DRAFT_63711 [Saccharata proteae CBS 121410]|uniref:Uncharacterized protein n=1 Tax=Saccharata proteae CBS 121410 TaxID=1314787 RepID=A0A6A5YFI3_9PEZI|nr:hypothetical protein K490DRAFT_63711 [Saccharata proteae CBS 121410]
MFLDRFRLGKAGAQGSRKTSGSPGKQEEMSRGVEMRSTQVAHPKQLVQHGNALVEKPSTQHAQNAQNKRSPTIRQVHDGHTAVHHRPQPQDVLQGSSSTLADTVEHHSAQSTPEPSAIHQPTPATTVSSIHDSTKGAIGGPAVYQPSAAEHPAQATRACTQGRPAEDVGETPAVYIPSGTPAPKNGQHSSLIKKTIRKAKKFFGRLRHRRAHGPSHSPNHQSATEQFEAGTLAPQESDQYQMARQMAELFCSGSTPMASMNSRNATNNNGGALENNGQALATQQPTWTSDQDRYLHCRQMAELFVSRAPTNAANGRGGIQGDDGNDPAKPPDTWAANCARGFIDLTTDAQIKRWLEAVTFYQGRPDEWRPSPAEIDPIIWPEDEVQICEGCTCSECGY